MFSFAASFPDYGLPFRNPVRAGLPNNSPRAHLSLCTTYLWTASDTYRPLAGRAETMGAGKRTSQAVAEQISLGRDIVPLFGSRLVQAESPSRRLSRATKPSPSVEVVCDDPRQVTDKPEVIPGHKSERLQTRNLPHHLRESLRARSSPRLQGPHTVRRAGLPAAARGRIRGAGRRTSAIRR